jgi:hypothetical protein
MKKVLCIALFLVLCASVYTQNGLRYEAVRYFSFFDNRYITARAAHVGWMEMYQTLSQAGTSRARALTYMNMYVEGKWSGWELAENVPVPGGNSNNLRNVYNYILEDWRKHPDIGADMAGDNFNLLRILSIPQGRNTPYWLDSDGDIHSYWKVYIIAP